MNTDECTAAHVPYKKGLDIFMPCAGNGQFFEESLLSALSQTHPDVIIYVVDNGCAHDNYKKITEKHKAERVKYVKFQRRLPMTENWQRCLGLGKSQFCAFLHDDDLWPSDYLKSSMQRMEAGKVDAVLARTARFIGGGAPHDLKDTLDFVRLSVETPAVRAAVMLTSCAAHMSSLIFRRGSVAFVVSRHFVADQSFADHFILQGSIAINESVTVLIREHAASATNATGRSRSTCEAQDRVLENLIYITRRGPLERRDLQSLLAFKDKSSYAQLAQALYAKSVPARFVPVRRELMQLKNWASAPGKLPALGYVFWVMPECLRRCLGLGIRSYRMSQDI